MESQITREAAWELLRKYNKDSFHLQHALTVEGVMRWYAVQLGFADEVDFWGMVGLLHDIDFELYPEFQKYLRTYQPPLLAVWGENDPSFIPEGAKAFKRDLPNAEIHFVPSGHFALESHHTEIAKLMRDFLARTIR